jgi:hypothetical protein
MEEHQGTPAPEANVIVRSLDAITKYIKLFHLLVIIMTSVLGYFYITHVQQSLEDEKFLMSMNGYISDLKPVADVNCWTSIEKNGDVVAHMAMHNAGKNVVRITTLTRQLRGVSDDAPLGPPSERLPTSENGMDMDIPPSKVVYSDLSFRKDAFNRAPDDVKVVMTMELATSETIVRVAKTVLAKRIPESELDSFSQANLWCEGGLANAPPPPLPIMPMMPPPPLPPPPPKVGNN